MGKGRKGSASTVAILLPLQYCNGCNTGTVAILQWLQYWYRIVSPIYDVTCTYYLRLYIILYVHVIHTVFYMFCYIFVSVYILPLRNRLRTCVQGRRCALRGAVHILPLQYIYCRYSIVSARSLCGILSLDCKGKHREGQKV